MRQQEVWPRYKQEIGIELELLDTVSQTMTRFAHDAEKNGLNESTFYAAQTLLINLYTGIENILKRTRKAHNVRLPSGSESHHDLVDLFTENANNIGLPRLIPQTLEPQLMLLRRFLHVIIHGYGFKLAPDKIQTALLEAPSIYAAFKHEVQRYSDTLGDT